MNAALPPVIDLDSVDSTNRALADRVRDDSDLQAWTTISAEGQTAGRGRLDHRWQSPRGLNIACSILLRPKAPVECLGTLPLLAGLAVVHAVSRIDRETGDRLQIKWPNDVWYDGRKLCGILCEIPITTKAPCDGSTPLIVGIGINVNPALIDLPPDLRQAATSLRIVSSREWNRHDLLELFREELFDLYSSWSKIGACPHSVGSEIGVCPHPVEWGQTPKSDAGKWGQAPKNESGIRGLSPFMEELRERDMLLGKEISVEIGRDVESGIAAGIADDGSLLLRKASGEIEHVVAGDVHVCIDA